MCSFFPAARRTELSEYGSQIQASLSNAASTRHEKTVERHVQRVIQAEQEAEVAAAAATDSKKTAELTDAQKKALQMRAEKQEKAGMITHTFVLLFVRLYILISLLVASLGGSQPGASKSKSGDYLVATPTNIRFM